jgi:hypothetical protein
MFTVMIKAIYLQARGNRGVRRAGLAALGHLLSHKRAWRLMRAAGLHGRHPKAWKLTTVHAEKSKNPSTLDKIHVSEPEPLWRALSELCDDEVVEQEASIVPSYSDGTSTTDGCAPLTSVPRDE